MDKQWITACAVAQYGAFPRLIPNTAGRTTKSEILCGLSGEAFRIVLGEKYAVAPVSYGRLMVEVNGTSKQVLFGGQTHIIVNPNEIVPSDKIEIPVNSGETITLWMYNNGQNSSVSACRLEEKFSDVGDFCGMNFQPAIFEVKLPPGIESTQNLTGFIGVDVWAAKNSRQSSIVAFGDSITNMNFWVAPLYDRIRALTKDVALLNGGISGNRLLYDTHFPMMPGLQMFGQAGLTRMKWDLFGHSGVKAVILALGINDISQPSTDPMSPPVEERCTIKELIEGYKEFISAAHKANIKIIGATITPFGGYPSYNEETETLRIAANNWILSSGKFDMVIDFASSISNAENASQMDQKYDSGDHLHPGPSGGLAMSQAVDVEELLALALR